MADPAKPAWSITLAGTDYPLVPSVPALRALERQSGVTILGLVEAAAEGALTIDQMTSIAVCLVDAKDDDPLFQRAHVMARGRAAAIGAGPSPLADHVAAAIVGHGIAEATALLAFPLAMAIQGKTAADGGLVPGEASETGA